MSTFAVGENFGLKQPAKEILQCTERLQDQNKRQI